jgi:DegV family protein with EDD domain
LTPQLKARLDVTTVPLTLRLGDSEHIDDETLEIDAFMAEMKACSKPVSSAAPSPYLFKEALKAAKESFIVTLSAQLSSSYENAVLGCKLAGQSELEAYVFDSKSASAGELLIAVKLRELIGAKLPQSQIIGTVNQFIDNMKTYFVLDRYDNLLKNGRLSRIQSTLISLLNIKLIMGDDGCGRIALHGKARGNRQVIRKLLEFIEKSGKQTAGESFVVTHCNNHEMAKRLADAVRETFHFKEIFIVPTSGVSSLYADDQGIVMAF